MPRRLRQNKRRDLPPLDRWRLQARPEPSDRYLWDDFADDLLAGAEEIHRVSNLEAFWAFAPDVLADLRYRDSWPWDGDLDAFEERRRLHLSETAREGK